MLMIDAGMNKNQMDGDFLIQTPPAMTEPEHIQTLTLRSSKNSFRQSAHGMSSVSGL